MLRLPLRLVHERRRASHSPVLNAAQGPFWLWIATLAGAMYAGYPSHWCAAGTPPPPFRLLRTAPHRPAAFLRPRDAEQSSPMIADVMFQLSVARGHATARGRAPFQRVIAQPMAPRRFLGHRGLRATIAAESQRLRCFDDGNLCSIPPFSRTPPTLMMLLRFCARVREAFRKEAARWS